MKRAELPKQNMVKQLRKMLADNDRRLMSERIKRGIAIRKTKIIDR